MRPLSLSKMMSVCAAMLGGAYWDRYGRGRDLRAGHCAADDHLLFEPEPGRDSTLVSRTDRANGKIANWSPVGGTGMAIAERRGLSHKTVSTHISNIFSKLQVADRSQAGLGHPEL
jgi:Bacterial regulatory proteins, luxR family